MRRGHSERGIALLLVVWLLALLSVIGVTVAAGARTDVRVTRNRADTAQLRALADAGIWWALDRLLDADAQPLRLDGTPQRVMVGAHAIDVAVQDESGKLDLNAAPNEHIVELLAVAGLERGDAGAIGGEIERRRRRDGGDRVGFLAIEQLRRIDGLSAARYARIAPFVTVHSGSAQVDPRVAPAEVLKAIRVPKPEAAASGAPSGAVTVRAEAAAGDGARFVREAVIELDPSADPPFHVRAWRRGTQ